MTKAKAKAQAVAHMEVLLKQRPRDADEASEKWQDAEAVLDAYIEAVELRTADLPDRQEIGEACFCLISMFGFSSDSNSNLTLVQELLSLEVGIDMYAIMPSVRKLRDDAITRLQALAEAEAQAEQFKSPGPDPLYEDLF